MGSNTSHQSTPTALEPWSIEKSKWDAFVASCQSPTMIVAALMPGIMLLVLTLVSGFAWYFIAGNGGVLCTPAIIFALVTVMMAAVTYMLPASLIKRSRIWRQRAGAIWDANACVCATCLLPLPEPRRTVALIGEAPHACTHGFTHADQPQLVRYFESLASRDQRAATAVLRRLRQNAARRESQKPTHAPTLFRRALRPVHQCWQRYFASTLALRRRLIALIVVVLALCLVLSVFAGVFALAVAWVWIFMGAAYLVGANAKANALELAAGNTRDLRCASCTSALQESDCAHTCPSCACDLSRDGAFTATARRNPLRDWILGGVLLATAVWLPMTVLSQTLGSMRPQSLLEAAQRFPSLRTDVFKELRGRALSDSDQLLAAEAMLTALEETPLDHRLGREVPYISGSIANGTLPADWCERFARAIVRVHATVDGVIVAPDAIKDVATGTPLQLAIGLTGEPYWAPSLGVISVMLRDISVDGDTPGGGGPFAEVISMDELTGWFPFGENPQETWRSGMRAFQRKQRDEYLTRQPQMSELVDQRGRIVTLTDAGAHQVIVRGWLLVTPSPNAQPYFDLDVDGAPMLPTGSRGAFAFEIAYTLRAR